MCAEDKTNRVSLVNPDLNPIDSCGMSSSDASGIAQCNKGIFDSFKLLSIKKGTDSQERCATLRALDSTSL